MALTLEPSKRILESPNYKWWAYAAISVGLFLTVMDQSGVNIALPRIAEHFSADIPTVQWITLGYVLATSALFMPMGRISDIVGRKYVYMGGFVVFVAAAAVGGSAETLSVVVASKIVQGIGSAGIQANGMAMVADIFPERERGKALGLYMLIIGTGAISGPVIGGVLVSSLGWRSVFFASVPVGILAFAAALLILQRGPRMRGADSNSIRFDWAGAALSSTALVSLLYGVTSLHRAGIGSIEVAGGLALGVLLIVGFIMWELRVSDPMLDLNFFRSKVFSFGVSARFLSFLGGSSIFFLMPFYLVQGLGYEPSRAGLLMVPGAIAMAVVGPFSGRLSDRLGTRWLTVAGMAISGGSLIFFSTLTISSPASHVVVGMAMQGLGMGVFSSPNTSAIMSSISREEYGIASAFLNMTRTTANLSGVALATTMVTLTMASMGYEPSLAAVSEAGGIDVRTAFVAGLGRAFLVAGVLVFTAMALAAYRGEKPPASEDACDQEPDTRNEASGRKASDD